MRQGVVTGLAPGQLAYRILIAEDRHDNQILLGKLMTELGMEVKMAKNGKECIALFKQWRPDLIWMDWCMPVLDGEEATWQIRQLPGGNKVKIVAVTASAFTKKQEDLRAAGMDDYVRKPYRVDEIYHSLANQLGLKLLYSNEYLEQQSPRSYLDPEKLVGVGDELRASLREAVETLECGHIAEVIYRIANKDSVLARALSRLADQYDYPSILNVLDEAERRVVD
jgi:CheY-like chemotaxis protein